MHFPLYHTLYLLAPVISDCVAKEGERVAHNKSEKLSGDVQLVSFRQSPPFYAIDENRPHKRANYTGT